MESCQIYCWFEVNQRSAQGNDSGVVRPQRPHPNALGKRLGNYLYISIQKCLVYTIESNATKIGV